jgi:hypothetical protein
MWGRSTEPVLRRLAGLAPPRSGIGYDTAAGLDSRPDLLALKPTEFEHLIRALFEALGMKSWVTQADKDGSVDSIAVNDDPIFGGLCVIQAKQYRNVVGVQIVHALAGAIKDKNAVKGVLVTTSWVGKAGRDYAARNGGIEIIEGHQLKAMLQEHLGIDSRIGLPELPPDRRGAARTHLMLLPTVPPGTSRYCGLNQPDHTEYVVAASLRGTLAQNRLFCAGSKRNPRLITTDTESIWNPPTRNPLPKKVVCSYCLSPGQRVLAVESIVLGGMGVVTE